MSELKEPLEIMREMYNCPQDIQAMTYGDIASVYHAMRDDGRKISRLEEEISKLRQQREKSYDYQAALFDQYMKLARQYACECEKLCSEDWQDQDYCGWRAKKALE